MAKTLLVTGGAGFIGSHLSKALLNLGHKVVIVDNLSTGSKENLPEGADFVEIDLAKPDFIPSLPDRSYDAVLHLAAQSSGEISGENPLYDMQANSASTLLLSQWCLTKSIPVFLYASSMSIYGNTEILPVLEDTPCLPLSQYGVSKLTSEHVLRLASNQGLSVTNFRMFNVYGPGQNLNNMKQGMVSIFLAMVLRKEPVVVKGPFDRFRDFVYIDDVVNAWINALENPVPGSRSFNLGTGTSTTVKELIQGIIEAMDEDPKTYPVEQSDPTKGDQFGIYANIDKIKAELGWTPATDLKSGLAKMASWARGLTH